MNKEINVIEQIQSGDQKVIERLYSQHRKEFLLYASRFSINEEDILDIYQDSIVVLYENIQSGKLHALSSSVKTYLFAIGKYKIYNSLKLKPLHTEISESELFLPEEDTEQLLLQEENIQKLQKAYLQLGDKCRAVLKLFYYENRSIEEIKERLEYSSKDVVKSQKSRCIKHIKELLLKLK